MITISEIQYVYPGTLCANELSDDIMVVLFRESWNLECLDIWTLRDNSKDIFRRGRLSEIPKVQFPQVRQWLLSPDLSCPAGGFNKGVLIPLRVHNIVVLIPRALIRLYSCISVAVAVQ